MRKQCVPGRPSIAVRPGDEATPRGTLLVLSWAGASAIAVVVGRGPVVKYWTVQ